MVDARATLDERPREPSDAIKYDEVPEPGHSETLAALSRDPERRAKQDLRAGKRERELRLERQVQHHKDEEPQGRRQVRVSCSVALCRQERCAGRRGW